MIDNNDNVDLCANPIIDRLGTKELNTRAVTVMQDHSEQYCAWTMNPNSVHSIIYRS